MPKHRRRRATQPRGRKPLAPFGLRRLAEPTRSPPARSSKPKPPWGSPTRSAWRKVHREAMAALILYREALSTHALDVDLIERLAEYLQKAPGHLELAFRAG